MVAPIQSQREAVEPDPAGRTIAHGLSNYYADELDKIKGLKSSEIAPAISPARTFDEAIHRDNLALIGGEQ